MSSIQEKIQQAEKELLELRFQLVQERTALFYVLKNQTTGNYFVGTNKEDTPILHKAEFWTQRKFAEANASVRDEYRVATIFEV